MKALEFRDEQVLDCIKLKNGKYDNVFLAGYDRVTNEKYNEVSRDVRVPRHNVSCNDCWYDSTDGVVFADSQLMSTVKFNNEGKIYHKPHKSYDFNFETTRDMWLHWKYNGLMELYKNIGSGETIYDDDYVMRKPTSYRKYHNSSILLFGGGPSTNYLLNDKNNIPEVDYCWSVNHFYKNDKLPKIDLAVLGKEVDKFDPDLINYIKKNSTDIVFEEDKDDMVGEEHLQSLFPESTTFYKTRYSSKLGIGSRFLLYSIFLGVSKIYVVGLDGLNINDISAHAFEKDKKFPTWNGMDYTQTYHFIKRQFIIFWEYIHALQKIYDFEIINLAENYSDKSTFGLITKNWYTK